MGKIALGTAQFGMDYGFTRRKTQEEVNRILEVCQAQDVHFIDTARDYGDSEEKIGCYLKSHPHHSFQIATKIAGMTQDLAKDKKALERHLLDSVEASCAALGIKKIHLLQLHQTEPWILENIFFWENIRRIHKAGYFDLFGVSLYDTSRVEYLFKTQPGFIRFIQAPYNVFDRHFERFFPDLKREGISFMSRSVFLKGVITASANEIPVELKEILPFKKKLLNLAEKSGLLMDELAILAVLERDEVAYAIVGVNSEDELIRNVEAASKRAAFQKIMDELKKIKVADSFLTDPRRWKTL